MKLSPLAEVRGLDLGSPGSLVHAPGDGWGFRGAHCEIFRLDDRVVAAWDPRHDGVQLRHRLDGVVRSELRLRGVADGTLERHSGRGAVRASGPARAAAVHHYSADSRQDLRGLRIRCEYPPHRRSDGQDGFAFATGRRAGQVLCAGGYQARGSHSPNTPHRPCRTRLTQPKAHPPGLPPAKRRHRRHHRHPNQRAACNAKYVRIAEAPARLMESSASTTADFSSSQPRSTAAMIIAYSPLTW